MVSVVVPILIRSESQHRTTVACLEAAKTKTNLPFELIIVETESNFFRAYADVHIWEKHRTTSTRSINRGFHAATGEFVVLLTNDVIVSDGWLEHLLDCFKISDCGLSTLATTQFHHTQQNMIGEGIWFSVAAMHKKDAYFDEGYQGAWDDSDLLMRVYLSGRKMYRNYNCVVDHKVGMTLYGEAGHDTKFEAGKARFLEKWKDHKDTWIYNVLVTGYIV